MTRISKLAAEDWDPELRALLRPDTMSPLEQGMMRMFAHRPKIAKGLAALGGAMKTDRTLPERLIELVRLRIAFHNQCRSCMAIRYSDARADGVDEGLVCSLEKPMEAPDLTAPEKVALAYADRFATDHLAIGERMFADLRRHFDEGQIIELASWVAFCVGFGRLGAVMDMTEELPAAFRDTSGPVTPWGHEPVIVR